MKILVALSGGVDSSVAALLLRDAGHDVAGAYMRTWMNEEDVFADCPWEEDIQYATAVADALGIPFEVVNFMDDYREQVVNYLVEGYRRGITPNPDVMCNREMKFGVFREYARRAGFDAVATGHYCRRVEVAGRVAVAEGADKNKDQSYFLALVRPEQLENAFFPIGDLQKACVRALAAAAGLPTAQRKDSQGICFLGKVDINKFLKAYIPDQPGEIVDHRGDVRGEHAGLHHFTLGQRRGLGVPSNADGEHFVVVAKDFATNRLHIAFDQPDTPGLWHDTFRLHNLNWQRPPSPDAREIALLAKARYRDPSVSARLTLDGPDAAAITFTEPQRAVTAGQVCALYDGDVLVGGGVYASSL